MGRTHSFMAFGKQDDTRKVVSRDMPQLKAIETCEKEVLT